MHRLIVALGAVVLLAACNERNPLYCEGHPDDTVNCPQPDANGGCTADAHCPGQVCDVASGACVECTSDKAETCTGTEPVCGDDHACRACAAHTECEARVCLPDGSCAAESDVAYVSETGSGTACSRLTPCRTLADGLATDRPVLKLSGTLDEQLAITSRTVTILADPGTRLTSSSNGVLLEIEGTSTVAIHGLEISGASGAGNPGISIPTGSTATVSLEGCTISANQGGGISASGGTLAITRSTISGNQGGGIAVTGAAAAFDITNNFIIFNGEATGLGATQVGGAALLPNTAGSRFEHNTVAFNENDGSVFRAGVTCAGAMVGASGNLVYGNREGTTTNETTQRGGNCQFGTTLASGLVSGDLGFVSPLAAPFDFHLSAASPPSVVGAGGSCSGVDFDGEPRPNGGACDLGADELYP